MRFGKIPIQKRKTATVTPPEMGMGLLAEYPEAHGTTVDGAPASCRQVCDGVTDCSTCLDEQWAKEQSQMDTEEVELATSILRVVGPTRQVGASRNDLVVRPHVYLLLSIPSDALDGRRMSGKPSKSYCR